MLEATALLCYVGEDKTPQVTPNSGVAIFTTAAIRQCYCCLLQVITVQKGHWQGEEGWRWWQIHLGNLIRQCKYMHTQLKTQPAV